LACGVTTAYNLLNKPENEHLNLDSKMANTKHLFAKVISAMGASEPHIYKEAHKLVATCFQSTD
jgi:hypothetical protein